MVYDAQREKTVLYGGLAGMIYYNTTREFDGQNWQQVFPAHNPGTIAYFGLAYDFHRHRTVLFGGAPFGEAKETHS